ncbi:UNVERIFIED_ORG: tryptophan synthase beta subunit [Heyndrickxia coagulans]
MGEIPALESTHGTSFALKPAEMIAVCLSGCGDKDGEAASRLFGGENNG